MCSVSNRARDLSPKHIFTLYTSYSKPLTIQAAQLQMSKSVALYYCSLYEGGGTGGGVVMLGGGGGGGSVTSTELIEPCRQRKLYHISLWQWRREAKSLNIFQLSHLLSMHSCMDTLNALTQEVEGLMVSSEVETKTNRRNSVPKLAPHSKSRAGGLFYFLSLFYMHCFFCIKAWK